MSQNPNDPRPLPFLAKQLYCGYHKGFVLVNLGDRHVKCPECGVTITEDRS